VPILIPKKRGKHGEKLTDTRMRTWADTREKKDKGGSPGVSGEKRLRRRISKNHRVRIEKKKNREGG